MIPVDRIPAISLEPPETLTLAHVLYKIALRDIALLEDLGDAVDQLERRARRHARANPRLRVALDDFGSGLRRMFDDVLYPDLLGCREAAAEHEDRMAREAQRLAPEFFDRVVSLNNAMDSGGADHG